MNQFEREEEYLEKQYNQGHLSHDEYVRLLNELARDYREAAMESAQDAYERELDRW